LHTFYTLSILTMLKKISSILFSTRLTGILFIVFAIAMGVGTFMDASEATSPTPYSRTMIYNAWWFEGIMGLFVINFIGNISRYRLFRKEKWATLIIHLSFIFIILGAFVTRYISYEGIIAIREGATENTMLTEKAYVTALIDGDYKIEGVPQRRKIKRHYFLSERLDNAFTIHSDYNEQPITITYENFISGAKEDLIPSETGEKYLKIVESGNGGRQTHWLKNEQVSSIQGVLFALNIPTEGAINLTLTEEGNYTIESPFEGEFMRMADQLKGSVAADSVQPLQLRSLYQMAGMAFVFPEPMTKGEFDLVKATADEPSNQDALVVKVTTNNESKIVRLFGGKGAAPKPVTVEVGGLVFHLTYGSESIELPFSITLNDFVAEKYPGTERAYKSYMSKVTINDLDNTSFDYDIFMNHILDHKGYRFFQASFDPDEQGTILSVNHDFYGTWITYIGYMLLYFGLMAILFDKNSRFGALKKMLDTVKAKKAKLATIAILFASSFGFTQEDTSQHAKTSLKQIDSIIQATAVSREHSDKFGRLIIQDDGGRMKPIHTFASELLRKVSKSDTYNGLNADQVMISMSEFPRLWVEVPLINLKRGNDSIRKVIGVSESTKNVSLMDLFDAKGNYKLEPYLASASSTSTPNQFQKDFIKAHENFYLLNQGLSGAILRIFPIPEDENNKWVSFPELQEAGLKGMDSLYTKNILPLYFTALKEAKKSGDYSKADAYLESITNYQKRYGSSVMPSENRVKAEIIYNKIDIFNKLYKYFLLVGALMFVFLVFQIFNEKNKTLTALVKISKYIIWIFFALMTLGLAARWYVSGHAPWSDAYESVIYVAWATVYFGLAFGRKSHLTIASTAFVASIILWVAHQNWMDPAIANLQAVLDSYWLMIHVSIIVGSYGPFTLGMILGLTTLLLMVLTTEKNKVKMDLNIKELTIITEMALTVGLVLLIIGNFLGGMWANESWGRYWGWDPKETWALVSIMIYAFVIHMRLIPGLRSRWFFNVMAVLAFSSIMMTYFGVNFYLTGLHSYASGDKPITPGFVYYSLAFIAILSTLAYFKFKKYYAKKLD